MAASSVLLVPQKMLMDKAGQGPSTQSSHSVHQRAFTLVTSEAANFQTFQHEQEFLERLSVYQG